MNINQKIGHGLKKLRGSMRAIDVARDSNISLDRYSLIEDGRARVLVVELVQLAPVFGCNAATLLKYCEEHSND